MIQTSIAKDDIDMIIELAEKGANLNQILSNGRTALIEATIQNRLRIMIELMKRGADVEQLSREAKNASQYALEMAGLDSDGKANVTRAMVILDPALAASERTAFMKFSGRGSADQLMRLLKEVGLDPNYRDEQGNTPLTFAIRKRKTLSVQVLVHWADCPDESAKASCLKLTATDVNFPGSDGIKPLTLAKQLGADELIPILIDAKAVE
ncbi:MAG: hypothetical protein IPL83_16010 [Bdellovibrionales bacterium]|nr:hypothetical protein [Bdellovibrionales bacterium]